MDDFKKKEASRTTSPIDDEDDLYLKDIQRRREFSSEWSIFSFFTIERMETKRLRNVIGFDLAQQKSENKTDFQRKKDLAFSRSIDALKLWVLL
jgi:hypothetical protein